MNSEEVTATEGNQDATAGAPEQEVLLVVSKLKSYIRSTSGMSTSAGVALVLSQAVRKLCDQAIEHAKSDGRKTVMERDFTPVTVA